MLSWTKLIGGMGGTVCLFLYLNAARSSITLRKSKYESLFPCILIPKLRREKIRLKIYFLNIISKIMVNNAVAVLIQFEGCNMAS